MKLLAGVLVCWCWWSTSSFASECTSEQLEGAVNAQKMAISRANGKAGVFYSQVRGGVADGKVILTYFMTDPVEHLVDVAMVAVVELDEACQPAQMIPGELH
ncbi:hypothetical protein K2X30_00545 [bacterium]|nr:hypothetical protein [bacterium]